MKNADQLQRGLDIIATNYAAQLATRLAAIEAAWAALCGGDLSAGQELRQRIHHLVGSGGTLGFSQVSAAARQLERAVGALDGLPSSNDTWRIEWMLGDLRRVAEGIAPRNAVAATLQDAPCEPDASKLERATKHLVLLVGETPTLHGAGQQLNAYGYDAQLRPNLAALTADDMQAGAAALIIDLGDTPAETTQIRAFSKRQQQAASPLPIIITARRTDLAARIEAVRMGAYSYHAQPLDIASLIDAIDNLVARALSTPYRVLIVDDDPLLAVAYARILQNAGMQTAVVNDPLTVLQALGDFQPDLLQLDMYMPNCVGSELVSVIRQQPDHLGLPIVFLSAETNRDEQLAAMSQGGDDFLTKPISPAHLVGAIRSRVERARVMRAAMMRDGLTGLLNHTTATTLLGRELERSVRCQTPLAVAMIDIDHFKVVNDTYGHPAGDRVLKGLARLLQQRLRSGDTIGRYGGEEFIVLLPAADVDAARRVLNDVRECFAQLRHQAEAANWSNTLSCGIASAWTGATAQQIVAAADAALYAAKRNGRNRVVVAG